mmetsp:Transcript_30/g.35  ORF Transcript_30/g.35 Transcript_30/m.35 type:complete len:536 (+) Transcript_30:306-1913(+)
MSIVKEVKVEIQVIDDRLLAEGLIAANADSDSPYTGEINLVDIAPSAIKLSMSFKNIGRIENLVGFDHLEKLCLDNNLLEEIVNLHHLKSLRWLDLSFNKIRKIQGLENLKNLEDLSLYCNKISIVENLDHCPNLQCLSLGNNRIDSLEQVIRLRQIRSLKMLTLSNNPIENNSEYRMTVLAYVDSLHYLDYAMIDKIEKLAAKEQYHDELLDVEEKEGVINEQVARDKASEQYVIQLGKASILFAYTMFDELFIEDQEIARLKNLPGVKEHMEQFRSGLKGMSEEYIRISMERYGRKQKDIGDFEKAIKKLRIGDDFESSSMIEEFYKSKKIVVIELTGGTTQKLQDSQRMVKKLQEELDKVCDELMSIELRLNEKFDALVDDFDNRMTDLKNTALEAQQLFFRAVEELEDKFSNGVRAVCTDMIDRYVREELAEDFLTEEAMALVNDKEVCMGLVGASHDQHIGRILKKEDEARSTETVRTTELVSSFTSGERARNRDRVLQIHDLHKSNKNNLASLLTAEEDDGNEDDETKA